MLSLPSFSTSRRGGGQLVMGWTVLAREPVNQSLVGVAQSCVGRSLDRIDGGSYKSALLQILSPPLFAPAPRYASLLCIIVCGHYGQRVLEHYWGNGGLSPVATCQYGWSCTRRTVISVRVMSCERLLILFFFSAAQCDEKKDTSLTACVMHLGPTLHSRRLISLTMHQCCAYC